MDIETDKPISRAEIQVKLTEKKQLVKKSVGFFVVIIAYIASCILFTWLNQEYNFFDRNDVFLNSVAIMAVFIVAPILAIYEALMFGNICELAKYEYAEGEQCLLIKKFLESNDPELKAFHHAVVIGQGRKLTIGEVEAMQAYYNCLEIKNACKEVYANPLIRSD